MSGKKKSYGIQGIFSSAAFLGFVAVLLVIVSIIIWRSQTISDKNHLAEAVESSLRTYASETEIRYANIFDGLDRLTARGVPGEQISILEWEADAIFYQETFQGLESVAWVDRSLVIRQLIPDSDQRFSIGQKTSSLQTDPEELLIWISSYSESEFQGFILGVVDLRSFLAPVIEEIDDQFMLQVSIEGDPIFHSQNWVVPDPDYVIRRSVNLRDTATLVIDFAPTEIELRRVVQNSRQILFLSLTLSVIAVMGLYFAQNFKALSDRSRARYRHLFEASRDAIFMVNPRGEYLDANPAAAKMVGYVPDELLQLTVRDVRDPQEVMTDEERFELWKNGGMEQMNLLHKDGSVIPVELTVSPVIADDELVYILGIARDITERIQAEQELKQHRDQLERLVEIRTEQLEEINQELTDFAYVVSHDLKAPLRAIIQLSNWISEDYQDRLDDDGQKKIELLVNRTNRMHNLIEGILEYSRIGRVEEHESRVDLNQLVEGVAGSLLNENHIQLSVQDNLPVVLGSQIRIEQVIQNLLENASKFMDKEQGQIKVSYTENQQEWIFSVDDNGPGISSKYSEKIFHLFQTLHSRDELESTGIGLAIVKKIVEGWNGKVWVESEPGRGSTFFFTIPKDMGYEAHKI